MRIKELEELYNQAIVKHCSREQVTNIFSEISTKVAAAQRKQQKQKSAPRGQSHIEV